MIPIEDWKKRLITISDEPTKPVLFAGEGVLRLHSGKYIHVMNLQPGDVSIYDIAHNLSNECRFGGGTIDFFSVAEHSVMCSYLVPENEALDALMHDGSEAILRDIPSPIKPLLTNYKEIEHYIMMFLAGEFKFVYPKSKNVEAADKQMMQYEWDYIVIDKKITPMTPKQAEKAFLDRYFELVGQKNPLP